MPLGCISYLNPEWNFTGVRGMSGSCEQNNTYNNTVLNIFSCCWTGSNSSHFPEMLTVSAVKISQDCVCNKCNERHNRRANAHTSLGNALRNAHCCMAWCISGWVSGNLWSEMCCGVSVFWLSDNQIRHGYKYLTLFLEGLVAAVFFLFFVFKDLNLMKRLRDCVHMIRIIHMFLFLPLM